MALLAIWTWLKNNWQWVLAILAAAALYFTGAHDGRKDEKARWVAVFDAAEKAAQERYDAQAATLAAATQDYLAEEAKNATQNADIDERVKNEIAKNPDYGTCHVGAEFMRAYGQLANPESAATPAK